MSYRYNDNTGNYEETPDDPIYTAPQPQTGERLGSYQVPINSNAPNGQQDLSYWQSRHDEGLPGAPGVDDMFDTATGQLKPGWKRTAKGYEYVGAGSTNPTVEDPYDPKNYPPNPNPRGYTPQTGLDFGDAGDAPAFNWSQFNPSRFSFGEYVPKFGPFSAPSMQDAENEPGYQFARDQGRKSLESSAAGRGVLRTGGTLKDILEYGDKFGEQNYNNVFNRKYQTWQGNSAWDRDNYTTNRDTAEQVFDRGYRGEKDAFDALHDSEGKTFQDNYNRWRDRLNSLTQIATAGANT